MSPNTLPDKLSCCLSSGTLHEQRTSAEKWIVELLKNCDVEDTRANYTLQMLPNRAVFTRKGE